MSANTYLPPTLVIPGALLITNITNDVQCVVTFTDSDLNTYIVGQCVFFQVPPTYGIFQIDNLTGKILSINNNNFTIDINTTQFDAFVTPSGPVAKPATIAPAGSRNLQFSNITNQVGFQNLNNIGN